MMQARIKDDFTSEGYASFNEASLQHAKRLGVTLRDLGRVLCQYPHEKKQREKEEAEAGSKS